MVALMALAALAASGGGNWQLAGKTYNSVAFVDMTSVRAAGSARTFTAMRVSGQPAKDGWRSVVQKLRVDCGTRIFDDGGSVIEQSDGSRKTYPGFGAKQGQRPEGLDARELHRGVVGPSRGRAVLLKRYLQI
jgi:hypothetical protein